MSEEKKSEPTIERVSPASLADNDVPESETLNTIQSIEKKLEEAQIPLRPEERKRIGLVISEVIQQRSFSGPQPPPELLKEYEELLPGSARQLLQMGFDEQQHRHRWEMRALDQNDRELDLDHRDATYQMTGLVLGFLALLCILGVGVYALSTGHVEVAIGCLSGGLAAAVVGAFVNGRSRKSQVSAPPAKDTEKAETMPKPSQKRRK